MNERRRRVPALLALAFAAAAVILISPNQVAAQPNTSAWYTVESRHSGLVLDVQGASTATGAILTQYTGHGGTNQQFRFIDAGNGYHRIQVRHSGLVLDVWNWSTADGAPVAQYTDLNATNQQWRVAANSAGYYTFVNRHSGKALDVYDWSTTPGSAIVQYTLTNAANQQFALVPVGAACGTDTVLADIQEASSATR